MTIPPTDDNKEAPGGPTSWVWLAGSHYVLVFCTVLSH